MPLVFEAAMNSVLRIDRIGLAEFLYAMAAFVDNLAVVDEGHADAGNVELLHCRFDELLHLGEALGVQRPGFASREGFAPIGARPQTSHNQANGGTALFEGGLLAVQMTTVHVFFARRAIDCTTARSLGEVS